MSIEHDLRCHPYFDHRKILSITPIHGGLNHEVHKVVCDDMTVVTRTASRGALNAVELQLQIELSQQGYTPKVLDRSDAVAVLSFIEGHHPTTGSDWSDERLSTFARLLSNIHRFQSDCVVDDIDLKRQIAVQLSRIEQTAEDRKRIALAHQMLEKLWALPQNPGLCHHDLNRLNIIFQQQRVWLIDWESAAIGDVFFDLAGFVYEQQLNEQQAEEFLRRYAEYNGWQWHGESAGEKLKLMKVAYCLICWAWYLERQQQSDKSYKRTDEYRQKLEQLLSQPGTTSSPGDS